MGFLNKISGLFGLGKDDPHSHPHPHPPPVAAAAAEIPANFHHRPTKGFSVPSEKPQLGPVIVPCEPGQGGVQGLNWYKQAMKIDKDGDVADEFLEEVSQDTAPLDKNQRIPRRFVVRAPSAPAVVTDQVVVDGMVKQQVEYNGMLQWV